MTYKFKYIKGQIYTDGLFYADFDTFINDNPDFPIVEGNYFEYKENGDIDIINSDGHHSSANPANYSQLITAINEL